jgi:hypothetical protein
MLTTEVSMLRDAVSSCHSKEKVCMFVEFQRDG